MLVADPGRDEFDGIRGEVPVPLHQAVEDDDEIAGIGTLRYERHAKLPAILAAENVSGADL